MNMATHMVNQKKNYKPETRHAFLAINAARTITEFLLASYKSISKIHFMNNNLYLHC